MGILVILWNILKIVICIILFVVLLVLIVMALILFSPICYQAIGSYEQYINGRFDIKWILGAIHAYGVYDKNELQFSLRLFGHCVYGADKRQKKNKKTIEYTQEDVVISARSKQEEQQQQNENEVYKNVKLETDAKQQQQNQKEEIKKEQTKQKHSRKKVSDSKKEIKQKKRNKNNKTKYKEKENKKNKIDKNYFIHMENKKELLQAVKIFLKRMLKGVLPKHCCLKATVGTGDPALTGYLLGIAGVAKMKFGKGVQITGDFTQKIVKDVFLDIKGKIVLGYLLYAVLRLLFVKPVYKTIMVIWKGYR
ncbi:hypothetical protein [Clostridium sp. MD294]|uniref:hypothetical protein n=1 Tax=Clostridium sp. MD294 TaxID=97138 RepID=UPI0002C8EF00|nr:hypothetical protein [Clostridium sp. MD294]NDO47408.1 hypothetical protein [Clostridium sp. MD294]USF29521.1 hypothetical protein C820_000912 [Clostridium sp. MD294]